MRLQSGSNLFPHKNYFLWQKQGLITFIIIIIDIVIEMCLHFNGMKFATIFVLDLMCFLIFLRIIR
jgi:hypothetical protein